LGDSIWKHRYIIHLGDKIEALHGVWFVWAIRTMDYSYNRRWTVNALLVKTTISEHCEFYEIMHNSPE